MRAADRAGRGGLDADHSDFALSAVGPAAGCGHLQLRRRQLAGRRVGGDHRSSSRPSTASRACATCRRPRRTTAPPASPSPFRPATTSTSPRSTCRTVWPPRRAGFLATVNNTGISITKANSNFVLAAGFYLARPLALSGLHLELPRRLRCGCVEARPRRGRGHHLRRAQVRHAHLARPRPSSRRAA